MSDMTYDPASHYDRVTDAWTLLLGEDLHYGLFATGREELAAATRALTDRMMVAAEVDAGLDVLDVGCGTGKPACELAAEVGARVVGISTSQVGINAAIARAVSMGVADRARFHVGDGMRNGLADESFDRVWVLESSHLMRHRDRLIAECARVLRPGGRLALCDIVLRRPMPFEDVRRLRVPLALLREVYGDARMEPLAWYSGMAVSAGLTVEVEADLTAGTRPTFAAWRDNARRHRAAAAESLGEAGLRRFLESCDVLESFWDDGTLGYALFAATKRITG